MNPFSFIKDIVVSIGALVAYGPAWTFNFMANTFVFAVLTLWPGLHLARFFYHWEWPTHALHLFGLLPDNFGMLASWIIVLMLELMSAFVRNMADVADSFGRAMQYRHLYRNNARTYYKLRS